MDHKVVNLCYLFVIHGVVCVFFLENKNKKNAIFSYPYDEYDNETIQALKQLNIKMAFTTEGNDVRPGMDLYKIPRKTILSDDTIEDFKKKINMW